MKWGPWRPSGRSHARLMAGWTSLRRSSWMPATARGAMPPRSLKLARGMSWCSKTISPSSCEKLNVYWGPWRPASSRRRRAESGMTGSGSGAAGGTCKHVRAGQRPRSAGPALSRAYWAKFCGIGGAGQYMGGGRVAHPPGGAGRLKWVTCRRGDTDAGTATGRAVPPAGAEVSPCTAADRPAGTSSQDRRRHAVLWEGLDE
jgi:hypothetical protein